MIAGVVSMNIGHEFDIWMMGNVVGNIVNNMCVVRDGCIFVVGENAAKIIVNSGIHFIHGVCDGDIHAGDGWDILGIDNIVFFFVVVCANRYIDGEFMGNMLVIAYQNIVVKCICLDVVDDLIWRAWMY